MLIASELKRSSRGAARHSATGFQGLTIDDPQTVRMNGSRLEISALAQPIGAS